MSQLEPQLRAILRAAELAGLRAAEQWGRATPGVRTYAQQIHHIAS